MKKIIYLIIIAFAVGAFSSCKQGDDVYAEYIVPGGLTYPQKADSLKAFGGTNRAKLEWLTPVDPQVVSARAFWNNYSDSLDVDIHTSDKRISVLIENLAVGSHTFYVKSYDAKGNESVPASASTIVFDSSYGLSLNPQPITMSSLDDFGVWSLRVGAYGDVVSSEIQYKSTDGSTKNKFVSATDGVVKIDDATAGSTYRYRSLYFGIDSIFTAYYDGKLPLLGVYSGITTVAIALKGELNPSPIASASINDIGQWFVQPCTLSDFSSEIEYNATDGSTKTITTNSSDKLLKITDAAVGKPFRYRGLHSGTYTAYSDGTLPFLGAYPNGAPHTPGIIEAKRFNLGGEGIGYHDIDDVNEGGKFRTDVGVDIHDASERVWTGWHEWLKYTIDVPTGVYHFAFWVGGGENVLELSVGAQTISVPLPDTGWVMQKIEGPDVTLSGGRQVITLYFPNGSFYLQQFEFTRK